MDAEGMHKVAVVGAGTMGPGLALVFARAGHSVSLFSRTDDTLDRALSVAAADLETLVRHGLLDAGDVSATLARMAPTRPLVKAGAGASLVERGDRGELGVQTGKGFFDYSGRDLEDILAARDHALITAFATFRELIGEPV